MRTHSAAHNDTPNGLDPGLRELTSSMIRFTNAVTLFSMQQMQNAVGAVTDSQAVINRFCGALDAISNTLSTEIDAGEHDQDERRDDGPHHGRHERSGAESQGSHRYHHRCHAQDHRFDGRY